MTVEGRRRGPGVASEVPRRAGGDGGAISICGRSTEKMEGVVEVSGPGSEKSSRVSGSSSCYVSPEDPRNNGERGAGPASSSLVETETGDFPLRTRLLDDSSEI